MPDKVIIDQTQSAIIQNCYRVLHKVDSNVVWDILRQTEPFKEWDHYPGGDVYDRDTHAQYYYHAHPPEQGERWPEHGHFHLFLRQEGMPRDCKPLSMAKEMRQNDAANLSHLIAISMDQFGRPLKLFTVNRWVTGETWYQAEDVCQMLDYFNIDHAWPSWPTNIWITEMVSYYKDEIKRLVYERDETVANWQAQYPDRNVYEDRRLEVTSEWVL